MLFYSETSLIGMPGQEALFLSGDVCVWADAYPTMSALYAFRIERTQQDACIITIIGQNEREVLFCVKGTSSMTIDVGDVTQEDLDYQCLIMIIMYAMSSTDQRDYHTSGVIFDSELEVDDPVIINAIPRLFNQKSGYAPMTS